MVTKKTQGKPGAGRTRMPPRSSPSAEIRSQPEGTDPEEQARYFMELLDSLAQQSDPAAADIRATLIATVAEYRDAKQKGDVEGARRTLVARLAAIEVGLVDVLLKTSRKIRDRLIDQSRRLGTGSSQGKTLRHAAESFAHLTDALQLLLEAARTQDKDLHAQAQLELGKAKTAVAALKLAP